MAKLGIFEQIYPAPVHEFRYKILETNETSDGMRTRVCDGIWKTLEEAKEELAKKEKR